MADVEQKVVADATAAVAAVKADVAKVETTVVTDWKTKVLPWLTHALAVVSGIAVAHTSFVTALVAKFL